jgi:hypothetical protein
MMLRLRPMWAKARLRHLVFVVYTLRHAAQIVPKVQFFKRALKAQRERAGLETLITYMEHQLCVLGALVAVN